MKLPNYQEDTYQIKRDSTDDDKQCRLRFIDCHKKYPLEDLQKKELKSFIAFAKKIESQTWRQIKFDDKGFNYETIDNKKLPTNSNGIIEMESLRVDGKFRIEGYRDNEFFYIVWFDRNHKAY